MNREQKRALKKRLPKNLTEEEKNRLIHLKELNELDAYLKEGDKVKINYEQIKSYPNYEEKLEGYRNLIEDFKDKICTVEYDKKYGEKPTLVCLKEDPNPIKYLFFIDDLIKQN